MTARESIESGKHNNARIRAYNAVAGLVEKFYCDMSALESALAWGAASVPAAMAALRETADRLESLAPDSAWPFPCYGQMFFQI